MILIKIKNKFLLLKQSATKIKRKKNSINKIKKFNLFMIRLIKIKILMVIYKIFRHLNHRPLQKSAIIIGLIVIPRSIYNN